MVALVRTDRLVAAYLERLDAAARRLPRGRRRELVDDIAAHLDDALGPQPTEAQVREALDRLGEPEDIVAVEAPAQPVRAGWHELLAVVLLLIGGIVVPVIGWLVGVVLLWSSQVWRTRDKLIGTLVLPGGLGGLVLAFGVLGVSSVGSAGFCSGPVRSAATGAIVRAGSCTGGAGGVAWGWIVLAIALVLAPILSGVYLLRRAYRPG